MRLCERLPHIVKSPEAFSQLTDEEQQKYLGYQFVRQSEELEIAMLGAMTKLG